MHAAGVILKVGSNMAALVTRAMLAVIAIALILVGLVVLPLPIPFGALMILAGVAILVSINAAAAEWVKGRRIRNPRLHRWLDAIETRLPGRLGDIVRRTAP
jgi:hypothetical protein